MAIGKDLLADLPGSHPANVVAGRSAAISELQSMPDRVRDAAALVVDGKSYAEAASILGTAKDGPSRAAYAGTGSGGQHDHRSLSRHGH